MLLDIIEIVLFDLALFLIKKEEASKLFVLLQNNLAGVDIRHY